MGGVRVLSRPYYVSVTGSDELYSYIERVVSLHQPGDVCVTVAMVAARLLELYILGGGGGANAEEGGVNEVDRLIKILR